jgi:DNA repair protein RadD
MGERWYQAEGRCGIQAKWDDGHRIVMYIAPTGAGKTYLFTNIGRRNRGTTLYAAHRSELVSQMSLALNFWGVEHSIIAPRDVIKWIVALHYKYHGQSSYRPYSNHYVTSIQTLHKQRMKWAPLLATVTMFVLDEGHHVLRDNIYGQVVAMMPNARGLLASATCIRADGRGLGRHADGVIDAVVVGPSMRTVIDDGYLVDYLVKSVPSDLRRENIPITAKGDYSTPRLTMAARESHIVGDIVEHYMEFARGLLGVTFVTDAQTGMDVAAKFNKAEVPAEFISHKTPGPKRYAMMEAYMAGELRQLVNIDLFGEGFDCPQMECCFFGRPSLSYPLIVQQFGRPLRVSWPDDLSPFDMETAAGRKAAIAVSKKPYAKLFDHVGNYLDSAHGLPDKRNIWTLDSRDRKQKVDPDAIPVRVCGQPLCQAVFERILPLCPYCGWKPELSTGGRRGPDEVDGKLCDLDPDTQRRLEIEAERAVQNPEAYRRELIAKRCPSVALERNIRRHRQRIAYQEALRPALAMYSKQCRALGMPDNEAQQRFYYKFGIDMLSAQSLPLRETKTLLERVVMEGL